MELYIQLYSLDQPVLTLELAARMDLYTQLYSLENPVLTLELAARIYL